MEPGWSPVGARLGPVWSPVGARLEPGWGPVPVSGRRSFSFSPPPPAARMARVTIAYLALMVPATHAAFRVLRTSGPRAACRPTAAVPRAAALFARSSRMMCTDVPAEGLSKTALKKLKKQEEQAARKAAKKAEKAAANVAEAVDSTAEADAEEPSATYSFADDGVLMSDASVLTSPRVYEPVRTLGAEDGRKVGEEVWVRGRLFRLRAGGNNCFLVVRSGGFYTVQACFFKDKATPRQSKKMLSWLSGLTVESIIDVRTLVESDLVAAPQLTSPILGTDPHGTGPPGSWLRCPLGARC